MKRELFFDCTPDWIRAAVVEDGTLCETHSERVGFKKATESLFLGCVKQIRPSVCAAFVDIGLEQNGFLPLGDIGDRPIRCGDYLVVQGAAKQATPTKGLRLTTKINLAGKWLVLVPNSLGVHVSKKVKDTALREELLLAARAICPPGFGLIVRTASQDVTSELLTQEANALLQRWQEVERRALGMIRPGILLERLPLDQRLIRDLAGQELERIVTNSRHGADLLAQMQRERQIPEGTRIEHYEERDQLIFDAFGLEEKIDRALRRRVWLPCGGTLIVDSCEAMTVIDVNSGKMTLGREVEDTALRVNLEAASEVARQLRLRDIGGMIVVDFIDMERPEHREELVRALRKATAPDRTQVNVLGLTPLGLMEITRKRVHAELHKALRTACSYCSGTGEVLSSEEVARRALASVRRKTLSGQRGPFAVRLAPAAADALARLTCPHGCDVFAVPTSGRHAERFDIEPLNSADSAPKGAVQLTKRMDI